MSWVGLRGILTYFRHTKSSRPDGLKGRLLLRLIIVEILLFFLPLL